MQRLSHALLIDATKASVPSFLNSSTIKDAVIIIQQYLLIFRLRCTSIEQVLSAATLKLTQK
jgi:hypothetical protein